MIKKIIALVLLFALFSGLPLAAQTKYLQFNATPHSSEMMLIDAVSVQDDSIPVTYFKLGADEQVVNASLRRLKSQGITINLPTVQQMLLSEQLPYIIAPSANREFGQHLLAIPELGKYPIAITASFGKSIFNLANLVLTEAPATAMEEYIVLTTWWDPAQPLPELVINFSTIKTGTEVQWLRLQYLCELTLSPRNGLELLGSAQQSYLKQLSESQDCIN